MIKAYDLITRARATIGMIRGRPKQADLRRATSDAYYAVFHALTLASAKVLVSGPRPKVRAYLRRGYGHAQIRKVCSGFASGNKPHGLLPALEGQVVSADLRALCRVTVDLQTRRHLADYDHLYRFALNDATLAIENAERALTLLDALTPQTDDVHYAFLVALFADRNMQ